MCWVFPVFILTCKQKSYHFQLHSYLVLFAVSWSHDGWPTSGWKLMALSVQSQVAPQRKAISWDHSYRYNVQDSTKKSLKIESEINIQESGWWCWWEVLAFQPRRKWGKIKKKRVKNQRNTAEGYKGEGNPNKPPNKQINKTRRRVLKSMEDYKKEKKPLNMILLEM